jgi:sporulation and spore germination protein/immunoglobulin-like protein involved in spore germination
MATRQHTALLSLLVAIAAFAVACTGASGPLGSVPGVSASPEASVAQGSPDVTPAPSADESQQPTGEPSVEPTEPASSPTASAKPSGTTTLVRAYFWLGGGQGSAGLVATLREVPGTKAVATAAVTALLAGPTALESRNAISTAVPDGTQLLGLSIEGGVATVNLSSEFATGGDADAVQTRTGQVVYTLTQFPSVKSVVVQVEGADPQKALGRADFTSLLSDIWVDRPAWNAAIGNPAHVTGSANVFEATFRISILDASGKVIADQQAMATCGTGCRGTFDVSVPYSVSKGQYGTLRVYDPSAVDGSPQSIRDYRVWLTKA